MVAKIEMLVGMALKEHDRAIRRVMFQVLSRKVFCFCGANVMPFFAISRTLQKWFGWNRTPKNHRMYRCLWRRLQKGC